MIASTRQISTVKLLMFVTCFISNIRVNQTMIYVGGSEKDMRKYYMYYMDRLECKKLIDSDISDRNKLVIEGKEIT